MSELTHYFVSGRGYWGRGDTLAQAIANAKHLSPGDRAFWARCTPTTRVDEVGHVYGHLSDATHGKIGRRGTFKAVTP